MTCFFQLTDKYMYSNSKDSQSVYQNFNTRISFHFFIKYLNK